MSAASSARRTFDVFLGETQSRQVIGLDQGHTTTIRLRGARPVVVLELTAFSAGGALPELEPLLGVAGAALAFARDEPGQLLLVAGHHPDEALGRARAEAVRTLLLGERDAFLALAAELSAADAERARAFAPPPAGDEPWPAVFARFEARLGERLEASSAELAAWRGAVGAATPCAVGCGAAWPVERTRIRAHTPSAAERVDVLLFAAEDAPELRCHAAGACAWKKCDVFRKGRYEAVTLEARGERAAPAPPTQPRPAQDVTILELPLASAFPAPAAGAVLQGGPLGAGGTNLEALALALRHAASGAAHKLVIAVHGGSDELARRRGENVLAFLQGRQAWAAHAQAHATVQDWQQLLKWVHGVKGWACDPGKVDGLAYGGTRKALSGFRTSYRAELEWLANTADGVVAADWRAFFDVYEQLLAAALGSDPAAARAAVAALAPEVVVCGAAQPSAEVEVHDYLGLEPERVELLFFAAEAVPTDLTPPLAAVYRGNAYHAEHLRYGGEAHALHVRALDGADRPLGGQRFEIVAGERVLRTGALDPHGQLYQPLPPGAYEVRIRGEQPPAGGDAAAAAAPEPWEGGEGTLEALLAGAYQRRGSYRADMAGFRNPDLQRWLEQACARAGVSPGALEQADASRGERGDDEQAVVRGLPQWLSVFQEQAARARGWGTDAQIQSRLLGAFYYAYFVEQLLGPRGVALPANVEHFLLHLGKSSVPGNGAATFEDIGGFTFGERPFAYCASASARAYLEGLERFGYRTSAKGYGPDKGSDCVVAAFGGRRAGAEHLPRPGDVLSVRTHLSKPQGHVVTVIWAEGDGTRQGTLWHVSGNSTWGAVAVNRSRYVDTSDRPPRGALAIINVCRNGELQPDRLEAKSDAELSALRITRAPDPNRFPGPNRPGELREQRRGGPDLASFAGLLAVGQAHTFPRSAPQEATILRAELAVVAFRGMLAGADRATLADEVALEPGRKLYLEWLVQDYERVLLEPGGRDLTERTRRGEPFLELDPASDLPDLQGRYRLVAVQGERQATASVSVRGILELSVTGRPPDDPQAPAPRLLRRVMEGGHPRFGTSSFHPAGSVSARAGSFQAITSFMSDDNQHWWWGQITPKSDTVLSWTVAAPEGARVRLTVNRKPNTMTPSPSVDVTDACQRHGGLLVGSYEHHHDGAFRNWWEADLELLDAGGAVLSSAVIRLRENYEMPGIASFTAAAPGGAPSAPPSYLNRGFPIYPGGRGAVSAARGDAVSFSWTLSGDSRGSGLRLVVLDPAGSELERTTLREWLRGGQTPIPPENLRKSDTRALPVGSGWPERVTVRLELFTQFATVARSSIELRIVAPGAANRPGQGAGGTGAGLGPAEAERAVGLRKSMGSPLRFTGDVKARYEQLSELSQVDGQASTTADHAICGPHSLLGTLFLVHPHAVQKAAIYARTKHDVEGAFFPIADGLGLALAELEGACRRIEHAKGSPRDLTILSALLQEIAYQEGAPVPDYSLGQSGITASGLRMIAAWIAEQPGITLPRLELHLLRLEGQGDAPPTQHWVGKAFFKSDWSPIIGNPAVDPAEVRVVAFDPWPDARGLARVYWYDSEGEADLAWLKHLAEKTGNQGRVVETMFLQGEVVRIKDLVENKYY